MRVTVAARPPVDPRDARCIVVPSNRRQFLRGGLALVALGLVDGCDLPRSPWQPAPRIPRIGYLGNGTSGPYPGFVSAFRHELAELGYVEGETVAIEYRFTDEG